MDPQIHVFSINGTIESPERRRRFWQSLSRIGQQTDEDQKREAQKKAEDEKAKKLESGLIDNLNSRADDIAAEIEREIRNVLPPASGISPQVEISFSAGSVLLSGTVLLLAWAGDTAWGELRAQLAEVIKIAVRRVVQGTVASLMPQMTAAISVTPARDQPTPSRTQPATPTSGETSRQVTLDWMRVLPIGIAVLLFFILIMDRYFTPIQRLNSPPTTTPQTSSPTR